MRIAQSHTLISIYKQMLHYARLPLANEEVEEEDDDDDDDDDAIDVFEDGSFDLEYEVGLLNQSRM